MTMINIRDIMDDMIAEGFSPEEALAAAKEQLANRREIASVRGKEYASKREEAKTAVKGKVPPFATVTLPPHVHRQAKKRGT